ASSASLCALLAGRERATDYASNAKGCTGNLVAYCSTQTHSSVEKAAKIAGLGAANLRAIPVDEKFAMRADALARQIAEDQSAGRSPCSAAPPSAPPSPTAAAPAPKIAGICRDHTLWLHVDAAMSGTAALCPEFRHIHAGVEHADSYCFNPHKWMFTN